MYSCLFSGQVPAVDDLPLTQIANRLNSAAARNKPERSPSVERTTPTTSASSQDSLAAVSVLRAVTPVATVSVPVTVAAPVTTVTNVPLRQDAPTTMPFTPIVAAAPVGTVTNMAVPQDMTTARSFTPTAAISAPVGTNVPGPRDAPPAMPYTPVAVTPAPVGTVTNVPGPQDMTVARSFTPIAAISAPVGTVTNVPRPQDTATAMRFTSVAVTPAPVGTVTNVPGHQDMRTAMSFTPVAAIPVPMATVTNVPGPEDLTTGIRMTPLMSTIQLPASVTPIQTMMTPTAAPVENITDTTQTMMATPISSKNPQRDSELVEAEIIDENTGEKVVMMLSPGQVAQLRAGALEVLPQDSERQTGDHQSTHSASRQVYEQFQETPKARSMEPVKEMRQTQAVRDKDGTVIGVQVSPRNPCNATTRRPLLPRKPSVGTFPGVAMPVGALPAVTLPVGALPAVTLPVGALPAVTLPVGVLPTVTLPVGASLPAVTSPVLGVNSVNQSNITVASTSSQGRVPPEVMRMNVSGLPVEHASEESESETLMFCDGANDEKPKKKKMRLSGPACAQLRRRPRSTPAREVRMQKVFLDLFVVSIFVDMQQSCL